MAWGIEKENFLELQNLAKGQKARISSIDDSDIVVAAKLREIGFAEGDEVEILQFGPFGATPICVRLNGTLIALRPKEASRIKVISILDVQATQILGVA